MDREPWFLLGEIEGGPYFVLLRQKEAPDRRADLRVAGWNLLKVGVGHGQSSGNRAPFVASQLVDVPVDAAIVLGITQQSFNERAVGLVVLAGVHNGLGNGMWVVGQKAFGKRRSALFGLGVLDP